MLCLHVFFLMKQFKIICVSFLFSAVGDQRAVQTKSATNNQPGQDRTILRQPKPS